MKWFPLFFLLIAGCEKHPVALTTEVYVWQDPVRAEVREAVSGSADLFSYFHVRAAEIRWTGEGFSMERPVDMLPFPGCGLVVRIGASASGIDWTPTHIAVIAEVFKELSNLDPSEIQCDFDCPTGRLESYSMLLEALQKASGEVPVVPTVLPSWLDSPAFVKMARGLMESRGYVLQVHSLVLPRNANESPVVFDPTASRKYALKASEIGVPYRIAMATYGCEVHFNAEGKVTDVVSEDTRSGTGAFASRGYALADPVASARLVREWKDDPPAGLRGIIWYRLPVAGDRRNWPIGSLRLVAMGVVAQSNVVVDSTDSRGARDLFVSNHGDFPVELPREIVIATPAVSADGTGAYRMEKSAGTLQFFRRSDIWPWLDPGERIAMGWLLPREQSARIDWNFSR